MAIDLSKLKALEFPKKEIELLILGEKQKLTITAHGDDLYLDLSDIKEKFPDNVEVRWRKRIFATCAGMDEADADLLIQRDGKAASELLSQIFELTDEFHTTRKTLRGEAEKNLPKGEADTTQS